MGAHAGTEFKQYFSKISHTYPFDNDHCSYNSKYITTPRRHSIHYSDVPQLKPKWRKDEMRSVLARTVCAGLQGTRRVQSTVYAD